MLPNCKNIRYMTHDKKEVLDIAQWGFPRIFSFLSSVQLGQHLFTPFQEWLVIIFTLRGVLAFNQQHQTLGQLNLYRLKNQLSPNKYEILIRCVNECMNEKETEIKTKRLEILNICYTIETYSPGLGLRAWDRSLGVRGRSQSNNYSEAGPRLFF